MTIFTIEIEGESKLAGITAARTRYNEDLLAADPEAEIMETDSEYVAFVMDKAAESYANQYGE